MARSTLSADDIRMSLDAQIAALEAQQAKLARNTPRSDPSPSSDRASIASVPGDEAGLRASANGAAAGPVIIPGPRVSQGTGFVPRRERPLAVRLAVIALTACVICTGLFSFVPVSPSSPIGSAKTWVDQAGIGLVTQVTGKPQTSGTWLWVLLCLVVGLVLGVVVSDAIQRRAAILQAVRRLLRISERKHSPEQSADVLAKLDNTVDHLKQVRLTIDQHPELVPVIGDIIGDRLKTTQRQQNRYAIVLTVLSSAISLIVGWLLSAVSPVSALAHLMSH